MRAHLLSRSQAAVVNSKGACVSNRSACAVKAPPLRDTSLIYENTVAV